MGRGLGRREDVVEGQLNNATIVVKRALISEAAHEENTAPIGFFDVLGRGGIRNVFEVKARALVGDLEVEVARQQFEFNDNGFVVLQFVAVDDGVVDICLCHSWCGCAVAVFLCRALQGARSGSRWVDVSQSGGLGCGI